MPFQSLWVAFLVAKMTSLAYFVHVTINFFLSEIIVLLFSFPAAGGITNLSALSLLIFFVLLAGL